MAKPLKVLIWYWGRRGGGPRYTLELARVLAQDEAIELYLSVSRQSDLFADFASIAFKDRFDIDTYTSASGFLFSSLRVPFLQRQFAQFLRKHEIDIVFCTMDHLWNSFFTGAIQKAGALYLLAVHDASRHPGEDQLWRRWLLKRDIDASDAALVLTPSVGRALHQNYAYPVERIFESVHGHFGDYILEKPRSLPSGRPLRVLFFGRILPYKGLDLLLDAMKILMPSRPDLELEIWGVGDLAPYQAALSDIGNVKIENRWIDEAEIPHIFERNDLLVLPYRDASQSGVVGVAMAYGMPCIATPIPGLSEQVKDGFNGIVVPAVDAESLAQGISEAMSHSELYHSLSEGCLETVRHELSWDRIGSAVASDLLTLSTKGPRSRSH